MIKILSARADRTVYRSLYQDVIACHKKRSSTNAEMHWVDLSWFLLSTGGVWWLTVFHFGQPFVYIRNAVLLGNLQSRRPALLLSPPYLFISIFDFLSESAINSHHHPIPLRFERVVDVRSSQRTQKWVLLLFRPTFFLHKDSSDSSSAMFYLKMHLLQIMVWEWGEHGMTEKSVVWQYGEVLWEQLTRHGEAWTLK